MTDQNLTNLATQQVLDPTQRPAQEDFILIDGSTSMSSKRNETLDAVDNFAAQLRSEAINSKLTVAAFSGGSGLDYRVLRLQTTPESWSDMRYDSEVELGSGMTPLYDAINAMCRDLRQRMPLKCSILIITDGDENASHTTAEQARALLDWCRAQGWQVTFLGADFENSRQAKLLGADASNSVGVNIKRLIDATSLLAEKRANYSRYGTDMNLTADEKNEIGGLLPDHSAK